MLNAKRQAPVATGTLPRLLQAMAADRSSASSIGDVVATDPGLTAKVFALANSAHYGLAREVERLDLAIELVGETMLPTMAIANAALLFDLDESMATVRGHAFTIGCAARLLAPSAGCGPAEAFAAGLLHDLGELLLWQISPREYGAVHDTWASHDEQCEAELAMFGRDHADIGAAHLKEWCVPPLLVDAVRTHANGERRTLLGVTVAMAEAVCANDLDELERLPIPMPDRGIADLQEDIAKSVAEMASLLIC
jgi:HD-like signal output (HDOD) protein